MLSEVAIVNAVRMQELARVILPFQTPSRVHGVSADERALPLC